jgi:glycine/D-amino acid oxidase-like deaminating enzyme
MKTISFSKKSRSMPNHTGVFSKHLKDYPHSIAVIGAGAAGSTLAVMLSGLGFKVTLIEGKETTFDKRSASLNNTGIIHHLIYGGDPEVQSHLFKAGMLFSELLPDHLFADNKMLYLAPPVIHGGKVNTAVVAGDISLPSNLIALKKDYKAYCRRPGAKAYYGPPEDFYQVLGEKQMRAMLGQPGEAAWLSPARDKNGRHFAMGAQVNQRVINTAYFAQHMQGIINALHQKKGDDFQILTRHHVSSIGRAGKGGFDIHYVEEAGKPAAHFDSVINAGHAKGLEAKSDAPQEAVHLKQKAYGIFHVPEPLRNQFAQSLFMVRSSELGGIVRMGPGLVALVSGKNYNRDDISFNEHGRRLVPEHWAKGATDATRRSDSRHTHSDVELLDAIQKDMAHWFPAVSKLEPVELRYGQHLYPPSRETANEVESAARADRSMYEKCDSGQFGRYGFFSAAKLTSIPFGALECALHVLEPYVKAGIITQEQVKEQLHMDAEGYAVVSDTLKTAMGKHLPN